MLKKIIHYLNPIEQLGSGKYSVLFPFLATLGVFSLSEIYANAILNDPDSVGIYIIFVTVALIIYFSFRDGLRGGFIAAALTICYYLYIIYTRQNAPEQIRSGLVTITILGTLYLLLAGIIGWLKQTIDKLIERESNEKQRLQAIVQQLPVGVLITDDKGNIVGVNKQVENMLGGKLNDIINSDNEIYVQDIRTGRSVKPSSWPINQAFSVGKTVVGKEYLLTGKEGKKLYLQVSASPIKNKRGKIIAAASIINDITSQKEEEGRKDDFVNMASHELKTPITSMKLYIDSLFRIMKNYNDDRTLKTLNGIKYQTLRLQELVSDLLDVSRLQTGKLSFSKESFRLDEMVKETLNGLQGATQDRKVTFKGNFPIKVHADKFRIYQVITNLITNAVKYSPPKTDIVVRLQRKDGLAIISVKDYGIGITKEQQKKVFERLYQVTDPKEKTFPGLGMGLYISKEIIKRHKGKIWVESEKDKGATFYFSLPLVKSEKK